MRNRSRKKSKVGAFPKYRSILMKKPVLLPSFLMGLKTGSAEKCTIELGRGDFIG